MTTTTTSAPATRTVTAGRFAAIGVGLAAIVIFACNYDLPKGENGGTGPAIWTAVLCAVVAAVLFGLVVPRSRHHERAALTLGILTVLSIAAFWSGVTPILGAATLAATGTD